MEKCIGCELCAGVCPADCIYVRGLDNPPDTRCRRASATATSTRSTTCAASTATSASRPARPRPSPSPSCSSSPSPTGPTPSTPRRAARRRRRPAAEASRGRTGGRATTCITSGWMRATSPSGSAAYEGEVQWSGELGYGVRAPEGGQSGRRDDAATGTKPLRDVLETHLLARGHPVRAPGHAGPDVAGPASADRTTKMDDPGAVRSCAPSGSSRGRAARRPTADAWPSARHGRHHPRPHHVRRRAACPGRGARGGDLAQLRCTPRCRWSLTLFGVAVALHRAAGATSSPRCRSSSTPGPSSSCSCS